MEFSTAATEPPLIYDEDTAGRVVFPGSASSPAHPAVGSVNSSAMVTWTVANFPTAASSLRARH